MIFPELENSHFGYVNLDLEARIWADIHPDELGESSNPFLDPVFCEKFVNEVHKKYNLDFSYGGWMEDRSQIWRDSYLKKDNKFIHLGVDINVPSQTKVATNFDAIVVHIDNDFPETMGWGQRVILKNAENNICMIYAHLDKDLMCKEGDSLKAGVAFAKVGAIGENGGWFPHIHVQSLDLEYFMYLKTNNVWQELDGYGSATDISNLAKNFKDPMQWISLIS